MIAAMISRDPIIFLAMFSSLKYFPPISMVNIMLVCFTVTTCVADASE